MALAVNQHAIGQLADLVGHAHLRRQQVGEAVQPFTADKGLLFALLAVTGQHHPQPVALAALHGLEHRQQGFAYRASRREEKQQGR